MRKTRNLSITLALLMALQGAGMPSTLLAAEHNAEADAFADEREAGETVEAAREENDENNENLNPAFNEMNSAGTYTVNVEALNSPCDIADLIVPLGTVQDVYPDLSGSGYTFVKAEVNGLQISAVREHEGDLYYIIQGGDGTPVKLADGESIVYVYQYQQPVSENSVSVEEVQPEAEFVDKQEEPAAEAVNTDSANTYHEVKFLDQDGNVLALQFVKNGTTTQAPAAPEIKNHRFTGWMDENGAVVTNLLISQNCVFTASYTEIQKPVTLEIRYVFEGGISAAPSWTAVVEPGTYKGSVKSPAVEGCDPDTAVVDFNLPEENQVITVTYTGKEVEYSVRHNVLNPDGEITESWVESELRGGAMTPSQAKPDELAGYTAEVLNQVLSADGSTIVDINYKPQEFLLTFNTVEGSYLKPQGVYVNEVFPKPETEPVKNGFTFIGWEYYQDGKKLEDQSKMPAGDAEARAVWAENTKAQYTVLFLQETLDSTPENPKYDLAQKKTAAGNVSDWYIVKDAMVGSEIQVKAEDDRYEGFHLNRDKTNAEVKTVDANGHTVKRIYYDRNEYSIEFYNKKTSSTPLRTLTAKYGADITQLWIDFAEDDNWKDWQTGATYTSFTNMPARNTKVYKSSSKGTNTVVYLLENADGDGYSVLSYGGFSFDYLTVEDQQDIEGFTYSDWHKDKYTFYVDNNGKVYSSKPWGIETTKYTGAWLRYKRNTYGVKFENCEGVSDISVRYEANLAAQLPDGSLAKAPDTVDSDYTFEGWYTSPTFDEDSRIDEDAFYKMPARVVTLYANWKAPEYTVTYDADGGTLSKESETLLKKTEIKPETPVKEGDTFLGWYVDAGLKHKFVPGTLLYEDMTLYARWENSSTYSYTVKYMCGDQEIAPAKTGTAAIGSVVEINAEHISGYYPGTAKTSAVIHTEGQEIILNYKPVETWSYQVVYTFPDKEEITETITTSDNIVQAVYEPQTGYVLDGSQVVNLSKDDDKKVITFNCIKNEADWTILHEFENADGTYSVKKTETFQKAAIGSYVKAQPMEETDTYKRVTGDDELGLVIRSGENKIVIRYDLKQYSVSYALDPASAEFAQEQGITLPETKDIKASVNYEVQQIKVPEGYRFTGWMLEGNTVQSFIMPAENVVLSGSIVRDFEQTAVSVKGIEKTYDGVKENIVITGLQNEDTVVLKDMAGNVIENSFVNVKDSQKVTVEVHNALADSALKLEASVKILPRELVVTSGSASKKYDGKVLTNSTWTQKGLVEGEGIQVIADGAVTEVTGLEGVDNTFDIVWSRADESNYHVVKEYGKLIITLADVQESFEPSKDLKMDAELNAFVKVYDGIESTLQAKALDAKGNDISETLGFVYTVKQNGETVQEGTALPVFKNAGTYTVTAVSTNKNFEKQELEALVIIQKRDAVIKTADASKEYDGLPLKNEKAEMSNFVPGEQPVLTFSGSITNVGSAENKAEIAGASSSFNADNYNVTIEFGTLSVKPARTNGIFEGSEGLDWNADLNGFEKTYDGITESIEAGARTEAGKDVSSDLKFVYTVVQNGEVVYEDSLKPEFKDAGEYEVTGISTNPDYETVKLQTIVVISRRQAVITTASMEKEYDALPLTKEEAVFENFLEGEKPELLYTGTITDAGSADNTAEIAENNRVFTADNYEITMHFGTLTVTPAMLLVETESASKEYDGEALTADGTLSGLKGDDNASLITTGLQTEPGESLNTYEIDWKDAKESNYVIEEKLGTLTVQEKAPVMEEGKPEDDKPETPVQEEVKPEVQTLKKPELVQTGSKTGLAAYTIAAAAAMMGILGLQKKRKKDKE